MNWMDLWKVLEETGALFAGGAALFILGGTFRWFEPISRFLGRMGIGPDPFSRARTWIAARRAVGDEVAAGRAEERFRDQRERMIRYGSAMMAVGTIIGALGVFVRTVALFP